MKFKLEADVAQEKLHKALQDLAEFQKVATGPVYERVFNHGYNRAGDSYERYVAELPTWTTAAPEVVRPDAPYDYSSLILPGFNEEEYMNQPVEEGNKGVVEVNGGNTGNELEARVGGEGTGNEGQDIPPEV
ncbi:hypothetical protein Acr_20g0010460 [Actinidia rufa]|uniref:Uncharacterized protein n=1 Tax=Actinidia rufa TaxID=165716 RepID=A0A7J0GEU6_9ERIC|nr:hypothetical protein Acr_20g0010460 [Actinidia rufa]